MRRAGVRQDEDETVTIDERHPAYRALPVAPWLGGKRNLAKRITGIIDATPHTVYAEPRLTTASQTVRAACGRPSCWSRAERSGASDPTAALRPTFHLCQQDSHAFTRFGTVAFAACTVALMTTIGRSSVG